MYIRRNISMPPEKAPLVPTGHILIDMRSDERWSTLFLGQLTQRRNDREDGEGKTGLESLTQRVQVAASLSRNHAVEECPIKPQRREGRRARPASVT